VEGKPHGMQTPCKQLAFSGSGRGFPRALLTRDFLYSTITFLTDAPLAQLDRALDFGLSGQMRPQLFADALAIYPVRRGVG